MASPVVGGAPEAVPGFFGRFFGMFNIFIDPAGAAKLIPLPWSWVWPMLLGGAVIGACQYLKVPAVLHVMQLSPPGNMTPEQVAKSLPVIEKTQKIMAFAIPFFGMAMAALMAGLLSAACAVLDIKSKFRDNFSLVANAGLIGAVGFLAGTLVVYLKGDDVQTMQGLSPGFGLDLLLSDGANKYLQGALNYLSIFTVWYIIMLGLTFAALTRVSKGKAFAATSPVWLLGMLFAMIGAIFRR